MSKKTKINDFNFTIIDQNDFAKRYARMLKDQAFYKKMEGKQK